MAAKALTALAALGVAATGLYADQAGVNDWHKSNLGAVEDLAFFGQEAVAASREGVVAALNARREGAVTWRQVLPAGAGALAHVEVKGRQAFTLSADGCWARMWLAATGSMAWDSKLCKVDAAPADRVDGLFLGEDLDADGDSDVVVLRGSAVTFLSGSSGKVLWEWSSDGGDVLQGLTAVAGGAVAFGRGPKGAPVAVSLVVADRAAKRAELAKDPADEAAGMAAVGVGGRVAVAWVDAKSKGLRAFTLADGKALAADKQIKAAAGETLSAVGSDRALPFVQLGAQVYGLAETGGALAASPLLDAKGGAVSGGAFVTGSSESGALVSVVQAGAGQATADQACGPVEQVVWQPFPGTQAFTLELPEDAAREGRRGAALRVFVQPAEVKEAGVVSVRVGIVFQDLSLVMVQYRVPQSGAAAESELLYVREEALAYVSDAQMIDLPGGAGGQGVYSDAELEDITNTLAHGSWVAQMSLRLRDQVRAVRSTLAGILLSGKQQVDLLVQSRGQVLVQAYKGELTQGQGYSDSALSNFGFHRGLLVLTSVGKVFLLDSLSGKVLFSVFDPSYGAGSVRMFVTRAHGAGLSHPAEAAFLNMDSGRVSWRNAHTGEVLKEVQHGAALREAVLISGERALHTEAEAGANSAAGAEGEEEVAPAGFVVALDADGKWMTFPKERQTWMEQHAGFRRSLHMLHFDADAGTLVGLGLGDEDNKAVTLWSFVVPAGHEVLTLQRHAGGAVSNPGIKRGDGSVLVKYLNPNLVLMATRTPLGDLVVTVLDGVSGRVVKRFSHKEGAGPVHAVLYDNSVVYSYWNAAHMRCEIAVIALFEGAIAKHELNLWTSRDEGDVGARDSFSSYDAESPSVMQRTFFSPRVVRSLGVTTTRLGIADRRVLMALEAGSINLQLRQLLDARRPLAAPTPLEKEEGLVQYQPELPMLPGFMLSYNLTVPRVEDIRSFPTRLESTTLVLATGLDLFFTRAMPSKGFDVLNEDFSFALLLALTGGLCVATVVLHGMVAQKQLDTLWK